MYCALTYGKANVPQKLPNIYFFTRTGPNLAKHKDAMH